MGDILMSEEHVLQEPYGLFKPWQERVGSQPWDATGQMVTFTQDVLASPDHLHTHQYTNGDQYAIGLPLMPQELADLLAADGLVTVSTGSPSSDEMTTHYYMWADIAYDGQLIAP